MRYSVTAFDPGARLVFTHGLLFSPRSAAFFAKMPAPSMTDGFDVLVQLVMAAITTEPFCNCTPSVPWAGAAAGAVLFLACKFGNASKNDFLTWLRGTRSCGRLGPASDGSTLPRSSAKRSVYIASGA